MDNASDEPDHADVEPAPTQLITEPTVKTVERFQGDQRELMVVSGTVSDPEFIAQEAQFLLNLNRINVALSRHVNGLVVIASRSLFGRIPTDVDKYDEARLWPGLAAATGLIDYQTDPLIETDLESLLTAANIDEDDLEALSINPADVTLSGHQL